MLSKIAFDSQSFWLVMANDASASDDGGFAMIVDDGQSPITVVSNGESANEQWWDMRHLILRKAGQIRTQAWKTAMVHM